MRLWKKILFTILMVVIIVPTAAFLSLQSSKVQTLVTAKIASLLSEEMDGRTTVGKVYLSLPNNLIIKDINLIYGQEDTVAHIGKFLVHLKLAPLLKGELSVKRIALDDSRLSIGKINDSTTNLSALLSPFISDRDKDTTASFIDLYSIRRLSVKNFSFQTRDTSKILERKDPASAYLMDFNNLDLDSINIDLRDIRYENMLSARIKEITMRESCGFSIENMSADIELDFDHICLNGLSLSDEYSDIQAELRMDLDTTKAGKSLIDRMKIDTRLGNSLVDSRTLRYFLPLGRMNTALMCKGDIYGKLNYLYFRKVEVNTPGYLTAMDIDGCVKGLPDLKKADVTVAVGLRRTNTTDLARLLRGLGVQKAAETISKLAVDETMKVDAVFDGTFNKFDSEITFSTDHSGEVLLFAKCDENEDDILTELDLAVCDLNLGNILGYNDLGLLNCTASASYGKDGLSETLNLSGFNIQGLSFKDYSYKDIFATGLIQDDKISLQIRGEDPNLNFLGIGSIDLNDGEGNRIYSVNLDLDGGNLHALNLDERINTHGSLHFNAELLQTPEKELFGQASLNDLSFSIEDDNFHVDHFSVESSKDSLFHIILDSDMMHGKYDGNLYVTDFINALKQQTVEEELGNLIASNGDVFDGLEPDCNITVDLDDTRPLCHFLVPDLFISDNTVATAFLKGTRAEVDMTSELVVYGDTYIKDISTHFSNENSGLNTYLTASSIELGNIKLENSFLKTFADDNEIDLECSFRNAGEIRNGGDIRTRLTFPSQDTSDVIVLAELLPSDLIIDGETWDITPSTFSYGKRHLGIHGFELSHAGHSLFIEGDASENPKDLIETKLTAFDLSVLNSFLGEDLQLDGTLTGSGSAAGLFGEDIGIQLDLSGHDVVVNKCPMGDISALCLWNDETERFDIRIDNSMDKRKPLLAEGFIHPESKDIDLNFSFERFEAGGVAKLLGSLLDDTRGTISGNVNIGGKTNKMVLSSNGLRFNEVKTKLGYTQVDYIVDGPMDLTSQGLKFNRVSIKDLDGNSAVMTGSVNFDNFKDINLDVRLNLQNIMGLNTTLAHNDTFYGKAYGTGDLRVTGPLDNINIRMRISPNSGTVIHVPLSGAAQGQTSLLTFIDLDRKLNDYDSIKIQKRKIFDKRQKSSLGIDLTLNATPDAEIQLEINKSTGDILKVRGNGDLGIAVKDGDFDIKGTYQVDEGSYHFVLLGISGKDFKINPGGTINFGGDIMQSDLNMTALYSTKASIGTLIADTTAVSSRRKVDCGIGITGKLSNPELAFSIEVPDLDPATKSRVESAFSTEEKRIKQVMALLVSGGFVPDEDSGIINNTTLLYSNVSEIMSSQLNNIFRQLDIPIDLGFKYQPTDNGRNIFDVAISTQLFNNRVMINGNIGNKQYASSSRSDVVGDIDVEIKLNKKGQLRLTLFSHSADQYSNYLDQSQRNGLGIAFQEDFDTFSELWHRIFKSKKQDERQTLPDSLHIRRLQSSDSTSIHRHRPNSDD